MDKKTWITIEIFRERYSFDTNLGLWKNMTLKEVIEQFEKYDENKVEKMRRR